MCVYVAAADSQPNVGAADSHGGTEKECRRVVAHLCRTTTSAISTQTRQNVKLTCRLHQLQNNTFLSMAVDAIESEAIHGIFFSLFFSLILSPVSSFPLGASMGYRSGKLCPMISIW